MKFGFFKSIFVVVRDLKVFPSHRLLELVLFQEVNNLFTRSVEISSGLITPWGNAPDFIVPEGKKGIFFNPLLVLAKTIFIHGDYVWNCAVGGEENV